jgi:PEP-CTERM motif
MRIQKLGKMFMGAALFVLAPLSIAHADSLNINYYTIASADPDANNLTGGVFNNEVQMLLGPNGLPVLNTPAYGCTSNCYNPAGAPTDVLADGEITYWSPANNSNVTETSTGVVTLPFNVSSNFFPPNGTGSGDGGSNGYQAAELFGNLVVPNGTSEDISFNIGADDMAFAYLDGQVVCDLGGVHGSTAGTCTTTLIGAGTHSLEVFFVDINQVQSGLTFGINTSDITTTPTSTPEPSSLALLGLGLVAFAFVARVRKTGACASR